MLDPLAIYGAGAATVSLGWQIYRERRRLKTTVRIELQHGHGFVEGWPLIGNHPEPPREYLLTVIVVNDGETTEYVHTIGVETPDGLGFGTDLDDRELQPRGRVAVTLRLGNKDSDLSAGFYLCAELGSGRVIRSGLEHLEMGVVEDVAQHNRQCGYASHATAHVPPLP